MLLNVYLLTYLLSLWHAPSTTGMDVRVYTVYATCHVGVNGYKI